MRRDFQGEMKAACMEKEAAGWALGEREVEEDLSECLKGLQDAKMTSRCCCEFIFPAEKGSASPYCSHACCQIGRVLLSRRVELVIF